MASESDDLKQPGEMPAADGEAVATIKRMHLSATPRHQDCFRDHMY
jgi:hypothetical protein